MKDADPKAYVIVGKLQIPLKDVEFHDVHEGMFGEDRVTFRYCGKVYESPVYTKR